MQTEQNVVAVLAHFLCSFCTFFVIELYVQKDQKSLLGRFDYWLLLRVLSVESNRDMVRNGADGSNKLTDCQTASSKSL